MSFTNKTVVITGAASGIGAATAVLFAKEGANLAIVDINEVNLKKVAEDCEKVGSKPLIIKANLSNEAETKSVNDKTINEYKQLDVLVNCAGIIRSDTIMDDDNLKVYDEITSVNLRPVIHLVSLAKSHLIKTKGNIVNVSSIGSTRMVPGYLSYCVSKAALDHFSRGAAIGLAPFGVRVNTVNPGSTYTDIMKTANIQVPWVELQASSAMNRISEPEEIGDLIVYLASDKAKSITGASYVIDNGTLLK